jgi:signal transduction histidine kinase
VGNALKYGTMVRIKLTRDADAVTVDVEDDGPGVPLEQRENVFEPFVRLNESSGGAGLGLPAARSIARAHGGDIVILDAEKGARLHVRLPG